MRKIAVLLLLALLSLTVHSQNDENLYKNAEFGVEVKFPTKFEDAGMGIFTIMQTTPDFFYSTGLIYAMDISTTGKRLEALNYMGNVTNKSAYKIGKYKVTNLDVTIKGRFYRYIVIETRDFTISASVMGETVPKDKDVYPFFNSIMIKGNVTQNPIASTNSYKDYALEYLSKTKTDTVKQIVYVNSGSKISYKFEKLSDVDNNIPQTQELNPYRFALIVGNEDYSSHQSDLKSESNVEFAHNDASSFKEYCIKTLGIPEKNITFLLDATGGQMDQGISKLKSLSKASNGKAQLIVFYAGHGLPDETTKEPYLIPVDVSGANVTSGIKLQNLYSNLTEFSSERVTIYLDACFTGGARNDGLIATRGVKVKPKEGVLNGNIVVFSSSSGDQSSLPYADQKHGMFTYYLLKKLQETKGDVTYFDLSSFLQEKISVESLLINSKEQNPVISISKDLGERWKSWRMK